MPCKMLGEQACEGHEMLLQGPKFQSIQPKYRIKPCWTLFIWCSLLFTAPGHCLNTTRATTSHLTTSRNQISYDGRTHPYRNEPYSAFCSSATFPYGRIRPCRNVEESLNRRSQSHDLASAESTFVCIPDRRAAITALMSTYSSITATETNTKDKGLLNMTEEERLRACSSMEALFGKCVTSCEKAGLSESMIAIENYINGYARLFSRFFEDPVEVPMPNEADEANVPGTGTSGDSRAEQCSENKISADGIGEKPAKASGSALDFYYTVDDPGPDGLNERRRYFVSLKPKVAKTLRSLIMQYRKKCMDILGRTMHKVSTMEDLRMITSVSRDASRHGMMVMKAMYYAMSVIHAKLGRFDKALEYIERMWSHGDRRRHRSYEHLLSYFEDRSDAEGMMKVLRHIVNQGRLSVSGLLFTRVIATIGISAKQELLRIIKDDIRMQNLPRYNSEITPEVNQGAKGDEKLAATYPVDSGLTRPKTKSELYANLKAQIEEVLEIYQKHACNKISLSSRLAYVIVKVFENTIPGAFTLSQVSPSEEECSNMYVQTLKTAAENYDTKDNIKPQQVEPGIVPSGPRLSHGNCLACGEVIPLVDLSIQDRLAVFRNWLQHIYDYNFPEVGRLANFYSWLHSSIRENRPYTCILDGQNIGYHKRQLTNPLDLEKIDMVVRVMVRRGEHPLVVLPYYANPEPDDPSVCDIVEKDTLQLLFPGQNIPKNLLCLSGMKPRKPKRFTQEEIATVDRWMAQKQAYICKMGSYDDNYFFMATLMTGCAEEMELMAKFLKASLELSFNQQGNQNVAKRVAAIPTPKVEDYIKTASKTVHCPVITVTNDTFTNLEIPGVDEHSMSALRDIPLTPYFLASDRPTAAYNGYRSHNDIGCKVLVGSRLKYTLEMRNDGKGKYHIPLGYERKVLDFRARHMVLVNKNEPPTVEPPLMGGYLEPPARGSKKNEHNSDQELMQTNKWLEQRGYSELLAALETGNRDRPPRRPDRGYVISTKTPELIKQKFNPSQQTRWLCVDLNVMDRANDK